MIEATRVHRLTEAPLTLHCIDGANPRTDIGISVRLVCDCGADSGWLQTGNLWHRAVKAHVARKHKFIQTHRLCKRA